jgi:hypothetical protein
MVDEEKPAGIVLRFDSSQFRIILSPIGVLPGAVEVVALQNIGARVGRDLADLATNHQPAMEGPLPFESGFFDSYSVPQGDQR